CQQHNTRPFTF
nr:immunoglobulin light chain junction region [Macaca mulatta]